MNELTIEDWGLVPYVDAWERQRRCFDETLEAVARNVVRPARIVLCEHPHVYTLGRSGKEANMLLDEEQLERIGATYYHIDRGGDITYHGPGQLVCYPILYLEDFHLGLKAYVHVLEEAVIRVCASYGVAAGRVDGATGLRMASRRGVWTEPRVSGWKAIRPVPARCAPLVSAAATSLPCTAWR